MKGERTKKEFKEWKKKPSLDGDDEDDDGRW